MKKTGLLLVALSASIFSFGQSSDSTGLEGDNLDLNGVLELFKESENLEEFEHKLNTEENGVNNLDLNEDGQVDYIKVVDHADSSSHALALQVPVTETESQDVAVLAMEKTDDQTTKLQVIGDSELYGENYMVEPRDEKNANIVVNVNAWRPVRHIYSPRYVRYQSPYRWGVHQRWYRPWRRVSWAVYRPRVVRYHRPCYRRATVRRCANIHTHYHKHHVHSKTFHAAHSQKHVTKSTGAHNHKNVKSAGSNHPQGSNKASAASNKNARTQQKQRTSPAKSKASGNQRSSSPSKSRANAPKRKSSQTRSSSGARNQRSKANTSRGTARKGRR